MIYAFLRAYVFVCVSQVRLRSRLATLEDVASVAKNKAETSVQAQHQQAEAGALRIITRWVKHRSIGLKRRAWMGWCKQVMLMAQQASAVRTLNRRITSALQQARKDKLILAFGQIRSFGSERAAILSRVFHFQTKTSMDT